MSNIPYPHLIEIKRAVDTGVDDEMGRDVFGEPATVDTVPAWVQAKAASERTLTTGGGDVRSTHTIFMDPPAIGLDESDVLVTVAVGGQGVTTHEIVGINDPDGTGDHYEIDTFVVEHQDG